MRADKQTSYSNTYSYNHNSRMKCKRVGKKNANTDNLSATLQAVIDPLDNQLGYMGYQETL